MKYLGYGQLALSQDAEGNVERWYKPGEELPGNMDKKVVAWLVTQGFQFDPMPSTEDMTPLFAAQQAVQQQAAQAFAATGQSAPTVEAPEQESRRGNKE